MVLVLAIAGVVTALTGELIDTIVIAAIVVLDGVVGFIQEYRAQRALEALRFLEGEEIIVRRNGVSVRIATTEVVLGDVVELAAGDLVPADLRLSETHTLRIAEAALTGESEPATKVATRLQVVEAPPIADRYNMAFKGTAVSFGRGVGVVVAVGSDTELGLVADLLAVRNEISTPLQRRLSDLARLMAGGAVAICGLIFIIGMIRAEPAREMFVTSVSLAVAAIPEGLPAIALGLEPLEPAAMQRRPRPTTEALFARGLWQHVVWVGLFTTAVVLTLEASTRAAGWPWQTMVFTTLALLQLAHSLAVRSEQRNIFRMSVRTNPWLYVSVVSTRAVQLLVVYLGPLQMIFHTSSLSMMQLTIVLLASVTILFAVELEKRLLRR